ncbi:MAG: hypothetical protein B7X86_09855 [Sphingobacteriales bacterium 17-39-43]|uniref:DUF1800 domain-containing protein n=1 Tax=Daejeonella sp. TaxID=2805397 RepID=UPI000BD452DA|nr:DUF1800 domain-containing protein [Daejeonella sp.]OYZ31178.1 MAG: hypothetical protein B7Y24_09795 [Sphingobacteriales bacterium 16-39-50]OZA24057.1 MAG: hypothetical protein B7X86_09855 [Sphingobacteriales bacterium 17-39-43]HQT58180.1 DUF1800 domain-containing protein [Daejeonella sp.]
MDRRSFLSVKANSKIDLSFKSRIYTGLSAFSPPFARKEIIHLLKRTLFGTKQADIRILSGKTLSEGLDILLNAEIVPDPPLNNYNDANFTDPNVPAGQTWVNAAFDGNANSRRYISFKSWWTGLMINQGTSIHEKMILFWHNHFATETLDIGDARYVYKHHMLLRKYALGNFKEFVKEITIDPAMLRYLNGYLNNKNSPDENYARELQELFTLGKGPKSNYTEGDVKAAARVLTGYTVNATTISSVFDPNRHDTGIKQFSSFYNNAIITGKSGANGAGETDELINMIFLQNETALHICRKLYRFFVYYEIDEATEANVITPMANLFRSSNYEIKPVLKVLFGSEHFFDPVNRAGLIKSPVDLCIGLVREFGMVFPNASDYVNQYFMHGYIRTQASNMQQNIGDPPGVSGWSAYYQEPQFHELWINADTLPRRNQFSDVMIGNGYTRNGKKINIDILAFVSSLSDPANPNTLINDSLEILYSIDITQQVRDFLKSILLSGQMSDSYWTDAWITYKANTSNTANRNIVLNRLQAMYKYLMNLPEYQLS